MLGALEELDLDAEIQKYAEGWKAEERKGEFAVGVCNYPTVPATVFAVEAARCMCGVDDGRGPRRLPGPDSHRQAIVNLSLLRHVVLLVLMAPEQSRRTHGKRQRA